MSQSTFLIRILGGRSMTIIYDNVANTITAAGTVTTGQSLSISTLSAALQAQFTAAVASATPFVAASSNPGGGGNYLANKAAPAFAGDNISAAVGAIMDATPSWRAAVMNAITTTKDIAGVPLSLVKDDTSSAQW
jgi:hypothetical protein